MEIYIFNVSMCLSLFKVIIGTVYYDSKAASGFWNNLLFFLFKLHPIVLYLCRVWSFGRCFLLCLFVGLFHFIYLHLMS